MKPRRHLRIKPYAGYDPNRKPRTEAQETAHRRTWRIVQLRSLWVLSCQVRTPWRLWLVRWLLDGELASMGAEKHGLRFRRQRAEFKAELKAHRSAREFADIPF